MSAISHWLDRTARYACLFIAILLGLAVATRLQPAPRSWPDYTTYGATRALSHASFLITPRHHALIWQPADPTIPFAYQPLDQPGTQIGLLLYGDIMPQQWQIVPAQADAFHIIWREADNRLRSALVHTSGETLRGPVELATHITSDITAAPAPDGGAIVLWTTASNRQIVTLTLDNEGRPGPVTAHVPRNVDYLAATSDHTGTLHAAWLTPAESRTWALRYAPIDPEGELADPAYTLHTFTLEPDASITTFELGLDQTFGYAIIGTNTAAQPDQAIITSITFRLDNPDETLTSTITLPAEQTFDSPLLDVKTGPVASLSSAETSDLPLRWPRPITGQHSFFALALAVQQDATWKPAVVYFANGSPYGYQVIADAPAGAAPPALHADANGELYMTWAGLQHAQTQRYSASTGGKGWVAAAPNTDQSLSRTLEGFTYGILASALWMIGPALVLLLAPPNHWTPALLCALYNMAKLLWPPDLFAHVPPLLAFDPLSHLPSAVVMGTAVTLITLAATGIASYAIPNRPRWQQWILFAVIDASLTWLVFGANLAS